MAKVRQYQESAAIMALVQLDICSVIANDFPEGAIPTMLAKKLNLDSRSLSALLMAATSFGLLNLEADHYSNTEVSSRYLCKNSNDYLGSSILSQADQYLGYSRVAEAVRTGKQVLPDLQNIGADNADNMALRRLILGLHSGGKQVVPKIMPHLAPFLDKANSLLDVGCGAGTYALAFAESYPQLQVTLLDQPAILEIAKDIVENSPAKNRVKLRATNYRTEELGDSTYNVVFFSQVLRTESAATIQELLVKAARALKRGGIVAIYDTLLEDSRKEPVENVLQNLTLSLTYSEGGLFTPAELENWLKDVGFEQPLFYPMPLARPMLLTIAKLKEETNRK